MKYDLKKLDQAQVSLTFTVTPADYKKDVENAAVKLSERAAIKGFRPGKAPYNIVKQQLGELKIMQEAVDAIIQKTYYEAIKAEKLETVGAPQVSIEKLAPGNDFVYKATVALMPEVKLADISKIKVEPKVVTVGEEDIKKVLEDLQKMQPKETATSDAATKNHKVVVDMNMSIDKVLVEGGQAKNHQVYLNEAHYIPGFADQLIGLKKDDTKEFTLPFPKEHYQKHLAGKNVDISVKVNDIFTLEYPEIDDVFAKSVGQDSVAKLKELIKTNVTREAENKEDQRQEVVILDQMIEKTTFGELPQVLVDSEKRKMFQELQYDLDRRGITVEKYLQDLKKTEEQIFKDFTEQATKRAKAALISRQVALDNKITVSKEDMDHELAMIKMSYPGDQTVEENLKRPEIIDTIAATLQNKKVIALLKEKIVGKKK